MSALSNNHRRLICASELLILCLAFALAALSPFKGAAQSDLLKAAAEASTPEKKIELCTQAIEAKPTRRAYFQRGWAFADAERYEEAVQDFKSGLATEGRTHPANLEAGLCAAYYQMGKYELAVSRGEKAVELYPEHAFALGYLGWAYYALEKYQESLSRFSRQRELEKPGEFNHYGMHLAQFALLDYEGALREIEAALALRKDHQPYIERKILTLTKLGRADEADALVESYIGDAEETGNSMKNRAAYYAQIGDWRQARGYYQKLVEEHEAAMARDPAYERANADEIYWAYLGRGNAYFGAGRHHEALADFFRAKDAKQDHHLVWMRIGELQCSALENYAESVEAYKRGFALEPDYPDGWINWGYAYSEMGDNRMSKEVYERAVKLDSLNGKGLLLNNLGYTYLELGDEPRALQTLRRAIEEEPQIVMSHVSLAEYYEAVGEYDKAVEKFTEALAMERASFKERMVSYYTRGLAYLKKGEYQKAREDFTKALSYDREHILALEKRGIALYYLELWSLAYQDLRKARYLEGPETVQTEEADKYFVKLVREHPECRGY